MACLKTLESLISSRVRNSGIVKKHLSCPINYQSRYKYYTGLGEQHGGFSPFNEAGL